MSFFPQDVLDEILNLIESVSEGFPTYSIIVSYALPTGVQLKREAKLLTVTGLITKHADCRITFILYPKRLYRMTTFLN